MRHQNSAGVVVVAVILLSHSASAWSATTYRDNVSLVSSSTSPSPRLSLSTLIPSAPGGLHSKSSYSAKISRRRFPYQRLQQAPIVLALTLAILVTNLGVMILFPSTSGAAAVPSDAASAVVDSSSGARGNTFKQKQSLEPILQVKASLKALLVALETASSSTTTKWSDVQAAVESSLSSKIPTTETEFKALFDAYSDPLSYQQRYVNNNAFLVYYTKGYDGPGRPSIESTLPTRQPLQFGARNEAWIAWSDFCAEFNYYKDQENTAASTDSVSIDDLIPPLRRAVEAVTTYLDVSGIGEAS